MGQDDTKVMGTDARLWLLGSLALAAAPHLDRFPLWLSALCVAVVCWRWLHDHSGWRLPPTALRLLLTLVSVGAVALTYGTLFGRDPGAALLTVMLCLKLLELKTLRDAMVVVFLGFFLVVSGFLYDQSIGAGAYLIGVSLVLITTLVALAHPNAKGPAAAGHLRTGAGILLQSLPLAVVLFVFFPRIAGPLWGLPEDAFSGRTGLSETLSMGSITDLADSDEVAFRVRFHGRRPPADQLYWRAMVLWRTDGKQWRRLPGIGGYALTAHQALSGGTAYTLTLEPHDKHWLPALDLPGNVPPDAHALLGFDLVTNEPVRERRQDRFVSYVDFNTGRLDPGSRRLALTLPPRTNPRARALAQRWRAESGNADAVVERALDYFRGNAFFYTRQPPRLTDDPVDGFLFGSRRGFCEHYAAAFTTLMRAAGIPSRIVTGYQGGEPNAFGEYLIVRQSDAHAWSEVWLDGRGWVRVDPTAVVPPERVEAAGDAARFDRLERNLAELGWFGRAWEELRLGWDALNHGWNQWVLGYGPEQQASLLRAMGLGNAGVKGLLWVLTLSSVFLLLAIALLLLRPKHVAAADPVMREYQRFCTKLARAGLRRRPSEGPKAYARRIARERPDLGPAVKLISDLYARLRYGRMEPREKWRRRLGEHVRAFRP